MRHASRKSPSKGQRLPIEPRGPIISGMPKYQDFQTAEENPFVAGVRDILPTELWELKDNVRIIDVRQPEEYVGELGHVPGSELIVLGTVPETLPSYSKDQTIVFVCRSGGRSAQASAYAQSQGFESVFNMKGGMLFWNDLKLPTET